jgi:hypothetical protein
MKLSKQDADLFFELMWTLQYFINQKLRILSIIKTLEDYIACSTEEKLKVRQALYEQPELIDTFIDGNPRQFSEEKLEIVKAWKQFIAGDFYIERMLKKYTIFISSDNNVYAVLALHDAFENMLYKGQLPVLVKAVLLPFKGKIVYDGLLQGYNIFFGSGISGDLKEIYMAAKQNGRIIESLESPGTQPATCKARKALKDWKPEFEKLVTRAKKLRGGGGQPAIYSPAFSLVKASLELGQLAVSDSEDVTRLWTCLEKVERALRKVETTLYRSER